MHTENKQQSWSPGPRDNPILDRRRRRPRIEIRLLIVLSSVPVSSLSEAFKEWLFLVRVPIMHEGRASIR